MFQDLWALYFEHSLLSFKILHFQIIADSASPLFKFLFPICVSLSAFFQYLHTTLGR